MHRQKWLCGLVLATSMFSPILAQAQSADSSKTALIQADAVCSRLPTIVNGGSSQLEIDEYFNKPEAQWTDQDLSRMSSDYSTCYESSTFDFGQKAIIQSEFSTIVRNIVASANKYRQAAKAFELEKLSYSPECRDIIADSLSDGTSSPEDTIPFQRISQMFKDGRHDEACDIDKGYSAEFQKRRITAMQCLDHAKTINSPTFKPEWFSALAGADDKLKSIFDADMSLNHCPS